VSPSRPAFLVVVVGTGTEVGKTWATCRVAEPARSRGVRVAARKPAQSFDAPPSGRPLEPTDADMLAGATSEQPGEVCPGHRWYPLAMAPPMAAEALGRPPLHLEELVGELHWPAGTELGFVETAGGVRSPLAHDADSGGLAHRLAPDLVLLVADAALGTINVTRLSMEALAPLRTVVLLNRYDPHDELHQRNRRWLDERDGYHVIVDPLDLPVP
jgi:dethiobiotin synthetase